MVKKILKTIFNVFLVFVIVSAAVVTVLTLTSKKDGIPNIFGYSPFSILTPSMEPTLKVGDIAICKVKDQNTKIAITGGYKTLTPWDTCSTGRHLHLSISRGLYLKEYTSWNTWTSKLINPRTMINFPKQGVWVSNRTTVY